MGKGKRFLESMVCLNEMCKTEFSACTVHCLACLCNLTLACGTNSQQLSPSILEMTLISSLCMSNPVDLVAQARWSIESDHLCPLLPYPEVKAFHIFPEQWETPHSSSCFNPYFTVITCDSQAKQLTSQSSNQMPILFWNCSLFESF